MANPVRVVVVGAAGRMGQRVMRLADQDARVAVVAAVDRGAAPAGVTVPWVPNVSAVLDHADVIVDFSAPAACSSVAPACSAAGKAYLVASTALTAEHHAALDAAAREVAVLQAANLSLGVNVLLELVEIAAARLADFDVEVFEIHHRHKKDAPSGTALALGEAARVARGAPMRVVRNRDGVTEPRQPNELGYAVARGGEVAGEHTVFLFGDEERLELTHRATNADLFARGALVAARWLSGRGPGRYTMRDVLRGS